MKDKMNKYQILAGIILFGSVWGLMECTLGGVKLGVPRAKCTAGNPWRTRISQPELVTELVSRHVVVTCYRVVSDLLLTCKPHFWPKKRL